MSHNKKDYIEYYSNRWNTSVEQKNFEEALVYAIKAYLIATDIGDDISKNTFLGLIRFAIHNLVDKSLNEFDKETKQNPNCSFCGKNAPEVKVVAGASGAICQNCATIIHEKFNKDNGT